MRDRQRIVIGVRDDAARRKLLQTRKLDLTTAVYICRAREIASRQLKSTTSSEDIHRLEATPKRSSSKGRARSQRGATLRAWKERNTTLPLLRPDARAALGIISGFGQICRSAQGGTYLLPAAVQSRRPEVATQTNSREIEFTRCRENRSRTC